MANLVDEFQVVADKYMCFSPGICPCTMEVVKLYSAMSPSVLDQYSRTPNSFAPNPKGGYDSFMKCAADLAKIKDLPQDSDVKAIVDAYKSIEKYQPLLNGLETVEGCNAICSPGLFYVDRPALSMPERSCAGVFPYIVNDAMYHFTASSGGVFIVSSFGLLLVSHYFKTYDNDGTILIRKF